MRNRMLAALFVVFVVFIGGGFSVAGAQQTTRIKKATDITPSWIYKGHWYGFVSCSRLQRLGNSATPDAVKKCVADGGVYILTGGGRLDLAPAEKAAPFAGQQVVITGTMTSKRYGGGPTSDASIEGQAAGGDRPASKFQGLTIISGEVMPPEPPKRDDYGAGRVAESAQ